MITFCKRNSYFFVGFVIVLFTFSISYHTPFFWDGLSKSERANWFFTNHFSQFVVPSEINSGHPPFWTLLLAFLWHIFGRSLFVSRILLLTLNISIVYQLQELIIKYRSNKIAWYWYLIIFLEPTFLAQTTILNNDILMLLMILIAINNIDKNRLLYTVGLLGMIFCNLRGMLFFTGFFLYEGFKLVQVDKTKFRFFLSKTLSYSIPLILFFSFLYYQFSVLGWAIKSSHGNWETQRQLVNFKQFTHNIIAIIWVFADYGRFFFLFFLVVTTVYIIKKRIPLKNHHINFFTLVGILFLINIITMSLTSNPIGHRYFILFYILGLLLFVNFIFLTIQQKIKRTLIITLATLLLCSGHFWIYPSNISQGWDSSLAYLNYFKIKKEMQHFVAQKKINPNQIGTKTRNPNLMQEYLLEGKQIQYNKNKKLSDYKYYLHSNIENNTSDQEIQLLKSKWILIKEFDKNGIFIKLYKSSNT